MQYETRRNNHKTKFNIQLPLLFKMSVEQFIDSTILKKQQQQQHENIILLHLKFPTAKL